MTFEEINQCTFGKEPCPDGLLPSEKRAYTFLEKLYAMYKAKLISKDVATELKQFEESYFAEFSKYEHDYIVGATAYKVLKQSEITEVKDLLDKLDNRDAV